jgi:hypothetical protein
VNTTIKYKCSTDPKQIEEWCTTALANQLHAGSRGMFQTWFTNPRNFKGLAIAFDGDNPVGIAVWLSFEYDADEMADRINTGCWVSPGFRRCGIGSELVTRIKLMADEEIRGFTGLYQQQRFWVVNSVDGRNIVGIYEMAADLETTPHQLGYFSVPESDDEQLSTGICCKNDND